MRTATALIAAVLVAPLGWGCNSEPPYNTLTEIPAGGDPAIKAPTPPKGARGKPPKPPGTKAGPHVSPEDIDPAPPAIPAQSKSKPKR